MSYALPLRAPESWFRQGRRSCKYLALQLKASAQACGDRVGGTDNQHIVGLSLMCSSGRSAGWCPLESPLTGAAGACPLHIGASGEAPPRLRARHVLSVVQQSDCGVLRRIDMVKGMVSRLM